MPSGNAFRLRCASRVMSLPPTHGKAVTASNWRWPRWLPGCWACPPMRCSAAPSATAAAALAFVMRSSECLPFSASPPPAVPLRLARAKNQRGLSRRYSENRRRHCRHRGPASREVQRAAQRDDRASDTGGGPVRRHGQIWPPNPGAALPESLDADPVRPQLRNCWRYREEKARALEAQQLLTALTKEKPVDLNFQWELAAVDDAVGNVLVAQGNLPEALQSY